MMVELMKPTLKNGSKICDVTSGSSGFLVGGFQYLLKENSSHIELDEENQLPKGLDGDKLSETDKVKLTENTFFGFDIDATMVRIGMMNMIMHGIKKPNIVNLNTLSDEYEKYYFGENLNDKNFKKYEKTFSSLGKDAFSHILANPPFSAKVNAKTISSNLNRVYEINPNAKKAQSLKTELLFLERIIYMLKKEGKASVVVPEGVLFSSNKSYKKIREILLKDCNLDAVISLPSGVFNPYTAVKTSILMFTKKQLNSTKYNTKKVWFYGLESDGYTLDSSRKKIKDDFPLPITIEQYVTRNKRNNPQKDRKQNHFYVPIKEIEKNDFELNYNLYRDFVFYEKTYEPPKQLLNELIKLEDEINEGISKLNISINED